MTLEQQQTIDQQQKIETCNKAGEEQDIFLPAYYKEPVTKEAREGIEKEYQKQIKKIGEYINNSKRVPYNKDVCLEKADEMYNKLEPILKKFYTPEQLAYRFYEKVAWQYEYSIFSLLEHYKRSEEEWGKSNAVLLNSVKKYTGNPEALSRLYGNIAVTYMNMSHGRTIVEYMEGLNNKEKKKYLEEDVVSMSKAIEYREKALNTGYSWIGQGDYYIRIAGNCLYNMETLDQLLEGDNTPEEVKKYKVQRAYFLEKRKEYIEKNKALPKGDRYEAPPNFLNILNYQLGEEMKDLDKSK